MTDEQLRGPIEAILMVASEPVSVDELAGALEADPLDVAETLRSLASEYLGQGEGPARGFELREVAGGWRIYSARAYADVVGRFVVGSSHARLSQAALETLAVIAYRQPISRARIARIRGVNVDGVVRTQGVRVDPATQVIHVDGERLILDETKHIVLAVNKPIGTVSTMSDPEGRPTIADLIADYPERLYHVGRLDIDTSGLLLLTNDGELANRLTHPSYEIRKTYVARLHGEVKPGVKRTLMNGIELEDGPIKVDAFRVVDTYGDITTVEIVVHEGRNRLVRRMMEAVGYPVRELVRTGFGPISLDHLKQGTTRRVKGNALTALYGAVGL